MITLKDLLKEGTGILQKAGIKEAGLDAWLLLEYITKKNRAYYFAHNEEIVKEADEEQYLSLCRKRGEHIPLQHLTHQVFFMGHEFYVNDKVLIPRQDTEVLVEEALEILKRIISPWILDMCTGSGCILLSILAQRKDAFGKGIDISQDALNVAKRNAKSLKREDHAFFVKSDLFSEINEQEKESNPIDGYDIIISNPPYIPTDEIKELMEEVRFHDPVLALDGKKDGLFFYRKITGQAKSYLKKGGWLLYEIGCTQGKDVVSLMEQEGFLNIQVKKDLAGLDRVVLGQIQ